MKKKIKKWFIKIKYLRNKHQKMIKKSNNEKKKIKKWLKKSNNEEKKIKKWLKKSVNHIFSDTLGPNLYKLEQFTKSPSIFHGSV